MLSITYVSSAAELLSEEQLRSLLKQSCRWNSSVGVTGMLLYCDGNFMQSIEGPAEEVDALFRSICADPRHRGLMELVREHIDERRFPAWSMGFRQVGAEAGHEDQCYSDFLSRRDHGPASAAAAHVLLESFKQTMR